ncbi:hypothetical protein LSUB1_G003621 [Lachnellula subtilissima]|uniref:UDP-galactose transporter n=1 Tax=Lachnellula subtilissima TaxID=602034 RepID=A0A8H8RR15_9HELO|nr:hypothetical protein LSUB1_G003621 [Lachnellula subtilissima]
MALSASSLLLIVYVSCETIRANYAYHAFHNFPQISASWIALLSEVLKLIIAIIFLLRSDNGITISGFHMFIQTAQQGQTDFKKMFRYALPAALYLVNNLIYYTVLPKTSPSLLQVCVLAKLPTTGILHHYMIKPQRNIHAWISLLFLCIGLVVFNIPSKTNEHKSIAEAELAWYLAPLAGFAIACFSALASISAETSTKTGDFWESQAYLYVCQMPWPPKDSKEFVGEQVPETEFVLIDEYSSREKEAITNDLTAETSTKGDLLQPDSTKILACAIAIAFATMEVALSKS